MGEAARRSQPNHASCPSVAERLSAADSALFGKLMRVGLEAA
jgi:hypothetical protein